MTKILALVLAAGLAGTALAQISVPGGGTPGPAPAPGPSPTPTPTPAPPAPPPSGVQAELDAMWKQYFVGEWYISVMNSGVKIEVDKIYRADGSYTGVQIMTGAGLSQSYALSGTYTLQGIDQSRFMLTERETGSGSQASALLVMVDQNTLQNQQQGYQAMRISR